MKKRTIKSRTSRKPRTTSRSKPAKARVKRKPRVTPKPKPVKTRVKRKPRATPKPKPVKIKSAKRRKSSPSKKGKRIFVSFDYDKDKNKKNLLVAQSKNKRTPFKITDYSLKEAAPDKKWESKARYKIKRSKKVIVVLGTHKSEKSSIF